MKRFAALALFSISCASLPNYVEKKIPEIKTEQKEKYGITYTSDPVIVFRKMDNMEAFHYKGTITIDPGLRDMDTTLRHEMLHLYAHELRTKMGIELTRTNETFIDDGIADYISRPLKRKCPKKFGEGKKGYEEIWRSRPSIFYRDAYCTAGPVIDQFGLEGIQAMIAYPPTDDEMKNLPSYTERIRNFLLNNNSSR